MRRLERQSTREKYIATGLSSTIDRSPLDLEQVVMIVFWNPTGLRFKFCASHCFFHGALLGLA